MIKKEKSTIKFTSLVFFVLVIGLICGVYIPEAEAAPECFGNNCYEFIQVSDPFVSVNNSWQTANAAASSRIYNGVHGHLATVTTQEENDFLLDLVSDLTFSGYTGAWLGGKSPEGWLTGPESGQAFSYNNFRPGGAAPNDQGYVYMQIGPAGTYNGSYLEPGDWEDDSLAGTSQGIPDPQADPVIGYFVEYEDAVIDTCPDINGQWIFRSNSITYNYYGTVATQIGGSMDLGIWTITQSRANNCLFTAVEHFYNPARQDRYYTGAIYMNGTKITFQRRGLDDPTRPVMPGIGFGEFTKFQKRTKLPLEMQFGFSGHGGEPYVVVPLDKNLAVSGIYTLYR